MSEFLFIRPGFGADCGYSWFVYDADSSEVLASGRSESLEELSNQNKENGERLVIVFYPSANALFKTVTFPGRLRKNPNLCLCMLEDELAQDINELEVRILHRIGNKYDVMIVNKDEITTLENSFKSCGFTIDRIVPDILAIPKDFKIANSVTSFKEILQKVKNFFNHKPSARALTNADAEPNIALEKNTANENKGGSNGEHNDGAQDNLESSEEDKDTVQNSTDELSATDSSSNVQDEFSESQTDAVALQLGDEWLVRTGPYTGFVIGNTWLSTIDSSEEACLRVTSLTPLPDNHPKLWQEELCSSVAEIMAQGALAQEFSLSRRYVQRKLQLEFAYPWYKVVGVALALIVLLFVNYNYAIKDLNQETQAYKQQQRIIFGKLTGSGPTTSNPVYSMKQLLSENSPIGTYEGFVDLTKKISDVLLKHEEMELVSLQYEQDRKQYVIRFLSDADWEIRKLSNELRSDFTVVLSDSKPSRNQVLYTVHLRRAK